MEQTVSPGDEEIPVIDYQEKYTTLAADSQKMRDEFNTQRAKLKELFLQKESDVKRLATSNEELRSQLDECRSQMGLLQLEKERELEEVASLKAFVQETINESRDEDDTRRLLREIERLRRENAKLNEVVLKQESNTLAPVLNQVKKFALKIGTDQSHASSDSASSSSHSSLDDAAAGGGQKKGNKYAQEDAEVLRSLVEPLEEEIKALKEKLRSTDDDLQKYVGANNSSPVHSPTCSKCMEWELEASTKSQRVDTLDKQVVRLHEDLERESRLRGELEKEWQEKKEQHKAALTDLTDQLKKSEEQMFLLTRNYNSIREEINQELFKVIAERESMYRHLETIQRENALLAGIYMKNADELEEQEIDLPGDVGELQEMLLQARHSIIEARVGWESERTKGMSLTEELQVLRHQLAKTNEDAKEQTKRLKGNTTEYMKLRAEFEKLQEQLKVARESNEKLDTEFKREMDELREQNIQLMTNQGKQTKLNEELKTKIITLQQNLESGEAVQQDFVRLSQSLQMELEKMRVADTQVRWQDDEDVDKCSNCTAQFTVTRRKQHCRHCGSIYCEKCLGKVVLCGPRKKPARVCDVCHTLLNSHMAPFFSSAVPKTP